jgi:hypothetical protein
MKKWKEVINLHSERENGIHELQRPLTGRIEEIASGRTGSSVVLTLRKSLAFS